MKLMILQSLKVKIHKILMHEKIKNKNKELEDLYVEKLRLEKPAKYWENRAKDLKKQGIIWSIFLVVVLGIGIAYFSYLFTHWLKGQEIALSLHSLQGAILLAVIISMFVFQSEYFLV